MGVTRIGSGSAAVVLSGADEAWVRGAVGRAMGGALKVMETAAQALADKARAEWYGPNGVERQTGKSGDIVTVTTVDLAKSEVRVSIGSTDDRTAGGKPLPVYVHRARPGRLGAVAVSQEAWMEWRRKGLPALPPPPSSFTRRDGKARSATSLRAEAASKAFWIKQLSDGGASRFAGVSRKLDSSKWYILHTESTPSTTGGETGTSRGFLLVELVRKPAREMVERIAPEIAQAIATRVNNG